MRLLVSRQDGLTQHVMADEVWPGLVVHRFVLWETTKVTDPSSWTVAHAETGRYIAIDFPSRTSATRAARAMGWVTDWTADAATIKEHVNMCGMLPLIVGIAESLGGRRP